MLPKPSVSFAIPSIHDGARLDCRIYHPETPQSHSAPRWARQVAVVAHPYAPLGGCYDDPIVDVVAGTLLQLGFMVFCFNFRGASTSSGTRTSWTSKPERADYMSVVGFMVYYAHYLDLPGRIARDEAQTPVLLQAGYSYGAMITTKLPPLENILAKFQSPAVHTPAADIRLRAQHLAVQQNKLFATPASPRKSLGMRVGGDDDSTSSIRKSRDYRDFTPRKSHDLFRSTSIDGEEKIRRGVKELLANTKLGRRKRRHRPDGQAEEVEQEEEHMEKIENLPRFRSAYLAVSPPVGFVTNLATMSFSNPLGSLTRRLSRNGNSSANNQPGEAEKEEMEAERKLVLNHTMSIYGDQDSFTTLRKLREWTSRLHGYEGSLFRHVEVTGAGHFWAEEGTIYELRDAVGAFGSEILSKTADTL